MDLEMPRDDETLVQDAQGAPEGDLRAFEELVTRHQQRVTTNCRYLTRSPDDAPDLAQEVMVKVFFSLSRFEGKAKLSQNRAVPDIAGVVDGLRTRPGGGAMADEMVQRSRSKEDQ